MLPTVSEHRDSPFGLFYLPTRTIHFLTYFFIFARRFGFSLRDLTASEPYQCIGRGGIFGCFYVGLTAGHCGDNSLIIVLKSVKQHQVYVAVVKFPKLWT